MPNRGTHIPVGILSPWLVLLAYVVILQNPIPSAFLDDSWIVVSLGIFLFSFVGERIPDTLEPPDNPQHRGIIHWIGFLPTLYVLIFFLTAPALPLNIGSYEESVGLFFISFCSGYTSHFVLDYLIG